MNANERIINSNFQLLEKAIASVTFREGEGEDKSGEIALIKRAIKELKCYLPNVEYSIKEYFTFGCTNFGKTYFYNRIFRNSERYSRIKETVANEDWSRF